MALYVLIPAYNEAATLPGVLSATADVFDPAHVLIVDDGSTDATAEVTRAAGFPCLRLQSNRGKAAAVRQGAQSLPPDAEAVLLLDADLVGLRSAHVELLRNTWQPAAVQHPQVMVVGRFRHGRARTDFAHRVAGLLSGQRIVPHTWLQAIPPECRPYSLEVWLHRYARVVAAPLTWVNLDGVSHRTQEEKWGVAHGLRRRARMMADVVAAMAISPLR